MLMRLENYFREYDRATEELLSNAGAGPSGSVDLPSGQRVQGSSGPARRRSHSIE